MRRTAQERRFRATGPSIEVKLKRTINDEDTRDAIIITIGETA